MTKILLDTDIGTDVDDAVCLAYLLAHPDCELLGITTVTGQPERRAALASVLCQAAGQAIPIFPGAEHPLRVTPRQPVAQQAVVLPRWPHQSNFQAGHAVEFMRRTIHAHPGEVVLLAIGPLTNVAQLFQAHPETAGLLAGLVLMGGIFDAASPAYLHGEWNILCDPHAADVVYRAPVRGHRSVGLDVTHQVAAPAHEIRRRFTTPLLQPVLDMAEVWFKQFNPFITFHDPLTAATVFDASLCTYAAGRVTVDLGESVGGTRFEPGEAGTPHLVATHVFPERYLAHFWDIVKA